MHIGKGQGEETWRVNFFDSGLQKTFPRTLFADTSWLIFKVACAWLGSPQPFSQRFHVRTHYWPSTCWNNCCSGSWGSAGCAAEEKKLSNTLWFGQEEWDYFSHKCVPQTTTHAHIHGSNPYSIKISPAVLHFLESSLNISEGWILPHPDAKGHRAPRGTYAFVPNRVFASRNWRDNWERCKSTMIKRKRRKKPSPVSNLLCLMLVVIF